MESPSAAAQVIITIIPIVGIVTGCAVIFFYLYYNYRQRMLMIDKGVIKKSNFDLDSFSLFSGLLLFGIGTSLTVFFAIKEGVSYSILSGLVPFSAGVSLIIFFVIRLKLKKDRNEK